MKPMYGGTSGVLKMPKHYKGKTGKARKKALKEHKKTLKKKKPRRRK